MEVLLRELMQEESALFMVGNRQAYCMGWFGPDASEVEVEDGWATLISDVCRVQVNLSAVERVELARGGTSADSSGGYVVQFLDENHAPRLSVSLSSDRAPDGTPYVDKVKACEARCLQGLLNASIGDRRVGQG